MRVFIYIMVLFFVGNFTGFSQQENLSLVDENATNETRLLYSFLKNKTSENILFGHHNTNLIGRDWKASKIDFTNSDVNKAVGDFPAIFSFDFNIGFERIKPAVISAQNQGAIITISWHLKNLSTGKNFYDTSGNIMERILPGNDLNKTYKQELDKVAEFANSLVESKNSTPIIFRPFHENTGDWFWWGAKYCSPEVYKKVWQFTVTYLRDKKGVHNFLYAYSPSKPSQLKNETYETRYPGNSFVDIIGFDRYGVNNYSEDLLNDCRLVVDFAEKNNKIAAITETGIKKGIQNASIENWYMDALLTPIKNDTIAKKIAYIVTWTNRNKNYWIPLYKDKNYEGFKSFYNDSFSWFLKDLEQNMTHN